MILESKQTLFHNFWIPTHWYMKFTSWLPKLIGQAFRKGAGPAAANSAQQRDAVRVETAARLTGWPNTAQGSGPRRKPAWVLALLLKSPRYLFYLQSYWKYYSPES
jgi:hypothetical protein